MLIKDKHLDCSACHETTPDILYLLFCSLKTQERQNFTIHVLEGNIFNQVNRKNAMPLQGNAIRAKLNACKQVSAAHLEKYIRLGFK